MFVNSYAVWRNGELVGLMLSGQWNHLIRATTHRVHTTTLSPLCSPLGPGVEGAVMVAFATAVGAADLRGVAGAAEAVAVVRRGELIGAVPAAARRD